MNMSPSVPIHQEIFFHSMYIIMNQNSSTMSKIDPQTHLKSCIENGVRLKRQAELEAIESELDELYDIHDNFEM